MKNAFLTRPNKCVAKLSIEIVCTISKKINHFLNLYTFPSYTFSVEYDSSFSNRIKRLDKLGYSVKSSGAC